MQGNSQVIAELNKVLFNELTAINQYFLHARTLDHWGLEVMGKFEYKQSIVVMKNADELTKRILFLEGLPNLQQLGKLRIGQNVEEVLQADTQLANVSHQMIKTAIAVCEQEKDYVSRSLLQEILSKQEDHLDWLGYNQDLFRDMGEQNYLQLQAAGDID